jgi:hypothetical protein
MSEQNLDYAAIRSNVEKGLRRQKWLYRVVFFVAHLLFFVVSMLAVWGTVAADSQLQSALFQSGAGIIVILPTILWTAVLLFHAAALYFESGMGEQAIRERLLMREVGEGILRQGRMDKGMSEKPKRHDAGSEAAPMRLSDDGELIEEQLFEHGSYDARTNHTASS